MAAAPLIRRKFSDFGSEALEPTRAAHDISVRGDIGLHAQERGLSPFLRNSYSPSTARMVSRMVWRGFHSVSVTHLEPSTAQRN